MTRRLFVTTALPYANAAFHIGHMMEYIQADTWVRLQRMLGHEVHFALASTAQPDLDASRVLVTGGSYGGYMTLAAMAFRPEAFKVGIDIFGVSNWLRTLESIPPYWESFRQALYQEIGDPVKDKDFLIATSPLFHAKEIRKPLMVIQGANDPRVPASEADQIVEAVRAKGGTAWHLVGTNEGHGFAKKENQDYLFWATLEFWKKNLLGGK